MATKSTAAAKTGTAKASTAKAKPAGSVATPLKDEAAKLAASSNQGSGDNNTNTNGSAEGNGEQGSAGTDNAANTSQGTADAGSAPSAPAGATGDGAGQDVTAAIAGAGGPSADPQNGSDGLGTLTDEQLAAASLLAADSARKDGDDEDKPEPEPELAAMLTRTLVNQTATSRRLPRLGVTIQAGESLVIGFRDEKHQAACESNIEQIRELSGWEEGAGLHWGLDE